MDLREEFYSDEIHGFKKRNVAIPRSLTQLKFYFYLFVSLFKGTGLKLKLTCMGRSRPKEGSRYVFFYFLRFSNSSIFLAVNAKLTSPEYVAGI
jgi:hypothetical protein